MGERCRQFNQFLSPFLLILIIAVKVTMELIKGKRSPYSITERTVPELIRVLGSQPAGDLSHKPGGRLIVIILSYLIEVR